MRSSPPLHISTHDLIHTDLHNNPFSLWSTGPSSPPFHPSPASLPSSSPGTPPEFEFDSLSSLQIKDDPPISPKLIPSFATSGFWGSAAVSSFDPLPPVSMMQQIPPLSPPITPTAQQPSAPPSSSVRQLLAEEMCGEHDDDLHLDFYSAPSTPMRTPPRSSAPIDPQQRPLSQDEPSLSIMTRPRRRKSNSAKLDRQGHDEFVLHKDQVLQASKSEPNSHFASWTSSFAWEKSEEEKSGVKKQGSKISMKWAFKDLLRKTVPSSKAESNYITKIMGASSSKKHLSSTKSSPNLSPLASPMHSTSMSTPQASYPSTPGRSPTHGSSSTPTRSPLRYPPSPGRPSAQTLNRSPAPSPPRSPLSLHAVHYQQNKAQSLELNRKTFLPYRQSLLGCLGGPSGFSPEQQAW